MVVYFFLGIVLLFGFWLIGRWYVQANPAQISGILKAIAFVLVVALMITFVVLGREAWALMMAPALIPWLMRARSLRNIWKAGQGPSGGQSSNVSTDSLAMELDHDTGEMDGTVLAGPFEGRRLSDLDAVLLVDLYRWMAANDDHGARLLEAYLDRTLGAAWREGAGHGSSSAGEPPPDAGMTREEAFQILGLEPDADAEAIRKAYRRLMQHAHPDKGGSPYLAAKINEAKDLLLGSQDG
ncbi:MAG: DnaJ domain-containing protein [Alphaproteobacteria bacterium]|nr:DnaJ domain-containing protein [Alphaproteobacteria bacterium]MCB9930565.1 DnaJ domain-containing protein [Alphaproteobacteria bacterium]